MQANKNGGADFETNKLVMIVTDQ